MSGWKQLAIESGLFDEDGSVNGEYNCDEEVELFANLIAAAEREACAKVCDNIYTGEEACGDWPTPEMCAEAIRARGNNAT